MQPKNSSFSSSKPQPENVTTQLLKIVRVGDVASSENKVRLEGHLSGMEGNLETISGNDWAEFRSLLKNEKLTEEQEQAIETTISMIQTMRTLRSEEDKKGILERFAKTSKIIDVAVARKFFRGHIVPFHSMDKIGLICSATSHLHDSLALVSNKYDVHEAAQLSGEVISDTELEEAIARGKTLKIS